MHLTVLPTEDPVPLSLTPGTHRGLLKRKLPWAVEAGIFLKSLRKPGTQLPFSKGTFENPTLCLSPDT